jgi:hypothetical protein
LYAIWHSPLVRSRLTLDDVDFTVLAATSVLDDLVVFCPPAKNLRDAFSKMTKTTIKMCIATTGFGSQVSVDKIQTPGATPSSSSMLSANMNSYQTTPQPRTAANPNFAYAPQDQQQQQMYGQIRKPKFDVEDWSNLFSPEDMEARMTQSFGQRLAQLSAQRPTQQFGPGRQAGFSATGELNSGGLPVDPSLMPMGGAARGQSPFPPGSANAQQQAVDHAAANSLQGLQSPWSDSLDFLDNISLPDQTTNAGTVPAVSVGGVAASGQAPFVPSTLDMGVGFGWDGSVPGAIWDDGDTAPVDMFDGFFFGGNMPTGMGGVGE